MSGQMLLFDEVCRAKLRRFPLVNPDIFGKRHKNHFGLATHFKNGKLYLFRGDHVTVVRPWGEKAGAWRKTRRGTWKHIRPHINVERAYVSSMHERKDSFLPIDPVCTVGEDDVDNGADFIDDYQDYMELDEAPMPRVIEQNSDRETLLTKERRAFSAFYESIPPHALDIARHTKNRQWHVLQLLNRAGQPAADLFMNNYALAWMLASAWVFHANTKPMRAARSLLKHKQRHIAGWLGFPSTDSAARILRRIKTQALYMPYMLGLRCAMADDPHTLKRLQHQNTLTPGMLFFLTKPHLCHLPSQKLLREISSCTKTEQNTIHYVMDSLHMNRRLDEPVRITHFKDNEHVKKIHDRLALLYNEFARSRVGNTKIEFPPPPLQGTCEIEPITKPEDLLKEGIDQHHCAASYGERVAMGAIYLYRVLQPERATLSICRKGAVWLIDQLKGFANKPVLPETLKHVERWLVSEQAKPFSSRVLPLME